MDMPPDASHTPHYQDLKDCCLFPNPSSPASATSGHPPPNSRGIPHALPLTSFYFLTTFASSPGNAIRLFVVSISRLLLFTISVFCLDYFCKQKFKRRIFKRILKEYLTTDNVTLLWINKILALNRWSFWPWQ